MNDGGATNVYGTRQTSTNLQLQNTKGKIKLGSHAPGMSIKETECMDVERMELAPDKAPTCTECSYSFLNLLNISSFGFSDENFAVMLQALRQIFLFILSSLFSARLLLLNLKFGLSLLFLVFHAPTFHFV